MTRRSSRRILIVTPAQAGSHVGNRTTAERWARIFGQLGHRVGIATSYDTQNADLLIALHAWRSAEAIRRFHAAHPERPLIVGLAGTDVYQYLQSDPQVTRASLNAADYLVGLHDLIGADLPPSAQDKLRIIYQSAEPLGTASIAATNHFDICVIAHLREIKDPLRAALAARDLPASSKIRVTNLGGAREPSQAKSAEQEAETNPRFIWRGDVEPDEVWQALRSSQLLVISSLAEGGANVISEAMAVGLPILASKVAGNIGLLGEDYPGYFPPRDTDALRALMREAETNPAFMAELRDACAKRAHLFTPAYETESWRKLLTECAEHQA